MPPGPRSARACGAPALESLLRDLGPWLRRGEAPQEAPRPCPTGIPALDEALGGGFPRGRVGEIVGPESSGRTSLALALLAASGRAGEVAAVVDAGDAFDPPSAEAAGVDLDRVLWVRAPERRAWLLATSRLLEAQGFALVLLDLAGAASPGSLPRAAWPRLARAAAGTRTALVVVAPQPVAGTCAALRLELDPARPCFSGTPLLFEGLRGRVRLARNPGGPAGREVPLHLPRCRAA